MCFVTRTVLYSLFYPQTLADTVSFLHFSCSVIQSLYCYDLINARHKLSEQLQTKDLSNLNVS